MSDKRFRDTNNKRRERRKYEPPGKSILQTPIILDRPERLEKPTAAPITMTLNNNDMEESINTNLHEQTEQDIGNFLSIPFIKRPNKFNSEAILKTLSDHPGHFVIGIIGKQGVGKSTILSHFTQDPDHIFPTQDKDELLYKGHKTMDIDMYVTPERAILLDTEPVLSWTVLDKVLSNGTLGGLHPDLWLEMESLYSIIFMMCICNVVLVVTDGPEIDMDLLRLVQKAEMLKFCIPDFPLLVGQQDIHYYPDIVFIANKCKPEEFTWKKYIDLESILKSFFQDSQLKSQGLVNLGKVLPLFEKETEKGPNLFLLPEKQENCIESFDVLVSALRDQVIAGPRRPGKKGQVSEKDWYRNTVKIFELLRKSEYISEYLQIARKLRDA